MKIALVHDWLNQKVGGGERVLLELARIYPEAPIYTLVYNQAKFGNLIDRHRVQSSRLQRLPKWLHQHPRYLLPLIPGAIKQWNFDEFDIVLTSSVAFVKNIKHSAGTTHICYCHSPMRFAWDYADRYLDEQKLDPVRRLAASKILDRVRRWDLEGSAGVNVWLANSKTVADRIKKFYNATAQVIYPPVAVHKFKPSKLVKKSDFYLIAASLTPYKKIDLAIKAFNASGRKLVIIGDGPQRKRLQKMCEPNIRLLGYVPEAKKIKLLQQAKALIFPNEEDFGIAPIEAMAAGTPVIAYGSGGLTETIIDGKTGSFFTEQTAKALNQAITKAEQTRFLFGDLIGQARNFTTEKFSSSIMEVVKNHVKAN